MKKTLISSINKGYVNVFILGNGTGNLDSNPEWHCLSFILYKYPRKRHESVSPYNYGSIEG